MKMEQSLAKSRSLQLSKEEQLLYEEANDQTNLFSRFFLLGYLTLAFLANGYLMVSLMGMQISLFYAFNTLCTGIGLMGVWLKKPLAVFLYTGYFTGCFIFASIIGMSGIIFLFSDDLCEQLASLGMDALSEACPANTGLIRLAGTAIVLTEVAIEAMVLWQLKKLYCELESYEAIADLETGHGKKKGGYMNI